MIKVMQIISDSNVGGAGRVLYNYLRYCDTSRYQMQVVLPRSSALIPEIQDMAQIIEADTIAEKSFSVAAVRELSRIISAEKPAIVHTHGSLSGRIAARRCGAKVVYTRHSAFPVPGYLQHGPFHVLSGAFNSYYADSIIAVSPACTENLVQSGVPARKITTLMNGVEPLQRAGDERCAALRQELSLPDGVFTAGILARLEPYKGHKLLLEAAAQLRDEGRDFRILIGGSGSCEAEICAQIKSLGLEQQVLFLGFVTNVSEILSILDVQLNCSWGTEASSIALIEGMSLGLATIASDYGGNPWQIQDGIDGMLFKSGDSKALAACIRTMMDSPETMASMQRSALQSYQTNFTGAVFAGNIEKVYENVLSQG